MKYFMEHKALKMLGMGRAVVFWAPYIFYANLRQQLTDQFTRLIL